MDATLSREVGRIMGKSTFTDDERARIIAALAVVDTRDELPKDIQDLLTRAEESVGSKR
jgi:hypothetical protein